MGGARRATSTRGWTRARRVARASRRGRKRRQPLHKEYEGRCTSHVSRRGRKRRDEGRREGNNHREREDDTTVAARDGTHIPSIVTRRMQGIAAPGERGDDATRPYATPRPSSRRGTVGDEARSGEATPDPHARPHESFRTWSRRGKGRRRAQSTGRGTRPARRRGSCIARSSATHRVRRDGRRRRRFAAADDEIDGWFRDRRAADRRRCESEDERAREEETTRDRGEEQRCLVSGSGNIDPIYMYIYRRVYIVASGDAPSVHIYILYIYIYI